MEEVTGAYEILVLAAQLRRWPQLELAFVLTRLEAEGVGVIDAFARDAISDGWGELVYEGSLSDGVAPVKPNIAMSPPSFPASHSLICPGPSPSCGMYW